MNSQDDEQKATNGLVYDPNDPRLLYPWKGGVTRTDLLEARSTADLLNRISAQDLQKLIEEKVTNGRGYDPVSFYSGKKKLAYVELRDHLARMEGKTIDPIEKTFHNYFSACYGNTHRL